MRVPPPRTRQQLDSSSRLSMTSSGPERDGHQRVSKWKLRISGRVATTALSVIYALHLSLLTQAASSSQDQVQLQTADSTGSYPGVIQYLNGNLHVPEGDAIYLQCLVRLPNLAGDIRERDPKPGGGFQLSVVWSRTPLVPSGLAPQIIVKDGQVVVTSPVEEFSSNSSSIRAARGRHRWHTRLRSSILATLEGQEHLLIVVNAKKATDQGTYSCQIYQGETLIEVRTSEVQVLTPEEYHHYHHYQEWSGNGGIAASGEDETEVSSRVKPEVVARYVIAKRGMDILLDCYDHDISLPAEGSTTDTSSIAWNREGSEQDKPLGYGRHLKLVRVDRWDSGVYYCAANNSIKDGGLVENRKRFHVNFAPLVSTDSAPLSRGQDLTSPTIPSVSAGSVDGDGLEGLGNQFVASGKIGQAAVLKCKVEAMPVPQVSWYQEVRDEEVGEYLSENGTYTGRGDQNRNNGTGGVRRRLLYSGDDFRITIGHYTDGIMETMLHIYRIEPSHLSCRYICVARNRNGLDSLAIHLQDTFSSSVAVNAEASGLVFGCLILIALLP